MAFSRSEAAKSVGMSLPVLDALLKRDRNPVPSFKVGHRVFVPVDGLRRWMEEEARRQSTEAFP